MVHSEERRRNIENKMQENLAEREQLREINKKRTDFVKKHLIAHDEEAGNRKSRRTAATEDEGDARSQFLESEHGGHIHLTKGGSQPGPRARRPTKVLR